MQNQIPLSEYPRPQLKRESYFSLNGIWQYKISKEETIPETFDGDILVPFSPECPLSGVNKFVSPKDYLFYKKEFDLPKEVDNEKIILHFTAVDQIAEVLINDHYLGKHIGGYLPFEFDIKPYVKEKDNILIVRVKDFSDTSFYSRGKQKIKRGGIWYSPQSGIYLPVWLEGVSFDYIQSLKITPDIDHEIVKINVKSDAKSAKVHFFDKIYEIIPNQEFILKVPNIHLGLSAMIYTQLSDVEDEINGLVTYDREVGDIPQPLNEEVGVSCSMIPTNQA